MSIERRQEPSAEVGSEMSTQSSRPPFAVTHDGAVVTVAIRRSSKRNALSLDMWQAIPDIVATAAASSQTRVLVLRGEPGGDFSAGSDISEFRTSRNGETGPGYSVAVRDAADAIAAAAVPTIAAIEGYCLGGGCRLAVACDLRIASETAQIGVPAARLGVVYSFEATKQLVDLIGPGWTRYMLLTAARMPASLCARIGLVHEVLPTAGFEDGLRSLAQHIASLAPLSQRAARQYMRLAVARYPNADGFEEQYSLSYSSTDSAEGISAFLERREPYFGA